MQNSDSAADSLAGFSDITWSFKLAAVVVLNGGFGLSVIGVRLTWKFDRLCAVFGTGNRRSKLVRGCSAR